MNLAEWLVRTARRQPDAPALFSGEDLVATYAGFAASAARIGAFLRARHHVEPGDRVAVFMKNSPVYLEVLYGIWFCGAAAVPINAKLHPREAAFIAEDSGAKVLFVSGNDELSGLLPARCAIHDLASDPASDAEIAALAEPEPRAPGDLAWLFYTSGTTGKPKGVMLTNANLHAMTYAYFVDVDGVLPEDAAVYAAPLSHGAGLCDFMHVLRGSRHVMSGVAAGSTHMHSTRRFDTSRRSHTLFAGAHKTHGRAVDGAASRGHRPGMRTMRSMAAARCICADIERGDGTVRRPFRSDLRSGRMPDDPDLAVTRRCRGPRTSETGANVWRRSGAAQSCVSVRVVGEDGDGHACGRRAARSSPRGAPVMLRILEKPRGHRPEHQERLAVDRRHGVVR